MDDMMLREVCASAGREPGELTRRDVARALLAVPATEALDALPGLRRELLAAGRPLSAAFWDRAEELLTAISQGAATVGDVHGFLEATGTEPIRFVAGGFLWPDEDERGPVANEMHARLVAHLEGLVAAGEIDPDLLLAGDPDALAAYEQVQVDWLYAPLDDGRQPIWAVSDEEDEGFFAAWDDAEADARQILGELLDEVGPRPCPETALHAAAGRLRRLLHENSWGADLMRGVAGDPAALPDDDRRLWLELASRAVTGGSLDPTADLPIDDDSHTAWMMLDHPAWIGAVVTLARLGPGATADADSLARYAASFDFEEDADLAEAEPDWAEPFADDADTYDAELSLSLGFHTVVLLWRLLGVVDDDERLTELGWWGLPEALDHAWRPSNERH